MDSNGVFAGVDDSLSGCEYKRKQAAEGRAGCQNETPDDRFLEKIIGAVRSFLASRF